MKATSLLKFKAVPPAWLAPAILLAWALDRYLPLLQLVSPPWSWLLASVTWAISLLITGTAARGLARHDTTIYPNGESTALVTAGLYRYTRNPMYLGMALIVMGFGFFFGSLTAFLGTVFFCLAVQQLFIIPEEQRLRGWFGEDYTNYCRTVRRWL